VAVSGRLNRILLFLHRVEDGILAVLLAAMIIIAAAQIGLRNFFDWNFSWGDSLTRLLVLWVGLLGALAATRENRHISIDVLSHLLPPRGRAATQALGSLFAAAVCGLVAWHAAGFVLDEYSGGSTGLLGLPEWLLHSIVPLGFALIALRYSILTASRSQAVITGKVKDDSAP
jgi:TRAP-type C4-dicarboxylate transport system permease small subunit